MVSLLPIGANAHSYKLGRISVGHIWAPLPKKKAKGLPVYGPILNHGEKAARLVGATSPAAAKVRFRLAKNGKAKWLKAIELPPDEPVSLAAWRAHIWLSGLRKPIKDGDSIRLILDFGAAGKLPVEVLVEAGGSHNH